jgi:hypothetical protein
MRERVKLDEAAGLRGESIEPRGLGGGARRTRTARSPGRTWLDMVEREPPARHERLIPALFEVCPTERAKLSQDSASCAGNGADHGGRVHDESNHVRGR